MRNGRVRDRDPGHRPRVRAAAGLDASVGVPPHDPLVVLGVVEHLGTLEDRGVVRRPLRVQVVRERVDLVGARLTVSVDGVVQPFEIRRQQVFARGDAAQCRAEILPVDGIRRSVDAHAGAVPVPVRAVLAVPVVDRLSVFFGRDDLTAVGLDVAPVGVVPLRLEVVGGPQPRVGERFESRVRHRRVHPRHPVGGIGGDAGARRERGCQRSGEDRHGGGREDSAGGEGASVRHRVGSVPRRFAATLGRLSAAGDVDVNTLETSTAHVYPRGHMPSAVCARRGGIPPRPSRGNPLAPRTGSRPTASRRPATPDPRTSRG